MTDAIAGATIRFHAHGATGTRPSLHVGTSPPSDAAGERLVVAAGLYGAGRTCLEQVRKEAPAISAWIRKNRTGRGRRGPLAGLEIVVEDASPDTCLSLIGIAGLITGKPLPDAWFDAGRGWEMGRMPARPEQSWAGLHNALVHALIDVGDAATTVPLALAEGLHFAELLIAADVDPELVDPSKLGGAAAALHGRAAAQLAQERLIYRNLASNALRVQLALPYADGPGRRLVDAIFFAEHVPLGAVRSYARSDASSWTGGGYSLGGVYRPKAPNGNDITFTIPPESGLTLLPLWEELEKREDAAWGPSRPRDTPRPGLAGYRLDSVSPSNDPWWDGGEDHSLVGAPGKFGVPSKLDWKAVLATVWDLFAPGGDLEVRGRTTGGAQRALMKVADDPTAIEDLADGSGLSIFDLERSGSPSDAPILWNPTFEAMLGAMAQGRTPTLLALPERPGFDLIRVGGGAAVVSGSGMVLLGSADDPLYRAADLRAAAERTATTLATARALERDLVAARKLVREAIPGGKGVHRRKALSSLYALQLRARDHWPMPLASLGDASDELVLACEKRWRASERFRAVLEEARDLEAMIISSTDNRTASLVGALAIYGFPAALFGNVLGAAFGPVASDGAPITAVALNAVIWFGALTAAAIAGLYLVGRLNRELWRKTMTTDR